jgi:uncharacterized protein (DUF433 family)
VPFIAAFNTSNIAATRRKAYSTGMGEVAISRNEEIMGGVPVFAGTRVPVQTLLDYIEGGETISEFLEGFPSVSREQVVAFLEDAKDRLVESVS